MTLSGTNTYVHNNRSCDLVEGVMIAAGQNLKRFLKKRIEDFTENTLENAGLRPARFLSIGGRIMKKLASHHFGPTFSTDWK
jgi:hypothetical protein